MSKLRELKSQIMADGIDLQIDDADWKRIRALLPREGPPDPDDLSVLTEIRTEARVICPAFDAYFFPVFKASLLADGKISSMEQFQLLRMLYGGGGIDDAERRFLRELRAELKDPSPEFEALYREAMKA